MCWLFICLSFLLRGQQVVSDSLFEQAKQHAAKKEYQRAISVTRRLIAAEPANEDFRLYLGQLHGWNRQYKKALTLIDSVLKKEPLRKDAVHARANVLLWQGDFLALKNYVSGIENPDDELLLLLGLAYEGLVDYKNALKSYNLVLTRDPANERVRAALREASVKAASNRISLQHFTDVFTRGQEGVWNLSALEYWRRLRRVVFIGRVNYATRYGVAALQAETDWYVTLKKSSLYVNYAFAREPLIFPNHRIAADYTRQLPGGWEAGAGFRYLFFENRSLPLFTANIGKYYRNWWFNLRSFYSFDNGRFTQAYLLNSRYHLKAPLSYLELVTAAGLSPDQATVDNLLLDGPERGLPNYLAQINWQQRIGAKLYARLSTGWQFEQLSRERQRTRLILSAGITCLF